MLNIYFQNEMIKILYGDKKGDYYGKSVECFDQCDRTGI